MRTLKEFREDKKMSQKQLAVAIGVKRSALSMWEIGKSKPDILIIPRLAECLGVSADEIISCFKQEQ